ncbi:hypothetical protein CLOSTASPAR_04798 [[Clostridium] asparagiforme DSM 15981]|uniref:Uncharacterized protein n=1 Tax=[Clostridium] asparagiforme DSM 15981 TaxID=518636 RepID=C0D6A1_9FIRM|nr:hypothetical protein CLOSTASPAR_04798 [[Clostridium] asparagiforme DSM 15981]
MRRGCRRRWFAAADEWNMGDERAGTGPRDVGGGALLFVRPAGRKE